MPCPVPRRTRTGARRLLPRLHGLPRFPGGSASVSSLSRPAQASLTLRPAELLDRPRRPLSRGFSPVSCPTEPLVSYQLNRQLAGWYLPPLVNRADWAHWGIRVKRNSGTVPAHRNNVPIGFRGWVVEGRHHDAPNDRTGGIAPQLHKDKV